MNRAKHVLNNKDRHHPKKLSSLEGTVEFSERSDNTLRLKLRDNNTSYRIQGEHRIDIGERVKLHSDDSGGIVFFEAYEVFHPNGDIKHRYCDRFCEFVDYKPLT